jgi:predicted membrane chloride channel (bestrophin family)
MRVCDGVWEHLGVLFQLRGSVVPKAFFVALPSAVISVLITSVAGWREEFQMFVEQNRPQTWLAVAAVVSLLVGFRSEQAWARMWEGTDLIHRMRGEWFDAFSCLFVFTRSAKKDSLEEVQQFRQTLLRLASMLHGCAMFEIANHDRIDADIDIIDFRGLDHETILHLRLCNANGFNKFEAILHMIYCLVTENHEKKVDSATRSH